MNEERLEQRLRDYFKTEVRNVEPSAEWWNKVISRLGEQEQHTRTTKPTFWKLRPFLITVPLSIFLLVILVGSLFPMLGGSSAPPPPAPAVIADGMGGSFVVWGTSANRYERVISAQHVDAQGNRLWGEQGKQVASVDVFSNPYAVSDNNGGIIITWIDRSGSNLKRLGSDGSTIWTLEHFTPLSVQGLVEDGSGGAILLLDNRNERIYAQRVNSDGSILWGQESVLIDTIRDILPGASFAGDGQGGAVIVWHTKNGTGITIQAQRLSAGGKTLWGDNGVSIATIAGGQGSHKQVISDGMGNFAIAWDTESGISGTPDTDVYVQKVDKEGNPLWGEKGILVCNDQATGSYNPANMQSQPEIAKDGIGGVIVTWHDRRRILNSEIFTQRISATGEVLWAENGVWLWNIPTDYPRTAGVLDSSIIGDGTGGAIIAWTGYGAPVGQKNSMVYVQRLSPDGQRLWADEEVYVNPVFQSQGYSSIIGDGQGGIVISSRVGAYSRIGRTDSVYAQRISPDGNHLWRDGGLEIQMTRSALTVQFIAVGAILAAILVLIGVFRKNRTAEIFTVILPVLLGIAGLFSMVLVIGPFGYTYGWAYIPDTVLNKAAAFVVPLAALAIGAVGIVRKTISLWVMVPLVVFCILIAVITGLLLIF